jgi:hypothetical protein
VRALESPQASLFVALFTCSNYRDIPATDSTSFSASEFQVRTRNSEMLGNEVRPISRDEATCKECKRLMWEIRLAEKGHLNQRENPVSAKAANYEKVYEIHLFSCHGLKR